jgi:hypothetical protein
MTGNGAWSILPTFRFFLEVSQPRHERLYNTWEPSTHRTGGRRTSTAVLVLDCRKCQTRNHEPSRKLAGTSCPHRIHGPIQVLALTRSDGMACPLRGHQSILVVLSTVILYLTRDNEASNVRGIARPLTFQVCYERRVWCLADRLPRTTASRRTPGLVAGCSGRWSGTEFLA